VLRNPDTGELYLIDFEYGGCNYVGFDIANHWNEWAGGTKPEENGVCQYERFPTAEQRTAFCQAYVAQRGGGAVDDDAVRALVCEAQRFVLVNHWYWALWAINQATLEGTAAFDYITYAKSRLEQYYKVKADYLG
jgi:ethanolamine kinase